MLGDFVIFWSLCKIRANLSKPNAIKWGEYCHAVYRTGQRDEKNTKSLRRPNKRFNEEGRAVRKPVNVNPGLNVISRIVFLCLKMFFTSNVWCSLRLLQLITEGQTI